jgi:hypothetical protein
MGEAFWFKRQPLCRGRQPFRPDRQRRPLPDSHARDAAEQGTRALQVSSGTERRELFLDTWNEALHSCANVRTNISPAQIIPVGRRMFPQV